MERDGPTRKEKEMTKMKSTKVLMVSAVLALTVGCAGTAFAASGTSTLTTSDGKQDVPVTGHYEGTAPVETYSVDLEWDDMTFTYTTTGDMTWDPATHTYKNGAAVNEGSWTAAGGGSSAGITATNHSNAGVNVAFSFAENTDTVGNFAGSLDTTSKQLAAGVENQPDAAEKVTSELSFSGTLGANNTTATDGNLGTLTVQLSPVN